MKVAVVLFNLGGACCSLGVKPFLYNLFSDPAIIGLPNPFRTMLAKFISSRRLHEATEIYNQIGGGSPILANTYSQAMALEEELNLSDVQAKVFICMRYSYPRIDDVSEQLELYKPDRVIFLSLYPQYSTTTVTSSVDEWKRKSRFKQTSYVESYHDCPLFITAYSDLIKDVIKDLDNPILLFSAHGIPLNRIHKGDPYQMQVEESSRLIVQSIERTNIEYEICYQSKVGPLKWLEPSTESVIKKYSVQHRNIVVIPVSFVSEHSETLVELDIQYKELAISMGAASYSRVPAVAVHPSYINCLVEKVRACLK